MKKSIGYVLGILTSVFLIQLNSGKYFVHAKNNVDIGIKTITKEQTKVVDKKFSVNINKLNRSNISIDKEWNIKFNQPVDRTSINKSIKIVSKDTNKQIIPFIYLKENDTVIVVRANYDAGCKYSLIIDKSLKSKNNSNLKNSVNMNFQIANIKSVDDLNMTTFSSNKIYLPTSVQALLTNGKTSKVHVRWNSNPSNLSEGNYEFIGTIKNWNGKVKLKLHVIKKQTEKGNITLSRGDNSYNNKKDNYIHNSNVDKSLYHSKLQQQLFNYLSNEDNRKSVMKRAIELHGGEKSNNCVYFASESLRRAGMNSLPEDTCNTRQLTNILTSRGWTKSTDLSKLKPGDICFTIAYYDNVPTHTYVFMKWVNEGKYDYAYICDNQGREYNGIYHKRNVNFQTATKDKISYFMYLNE